MYIHITGYIYFRRLILCAQGVANDTYFMPGPANDLQARAMLIEKHSPPEILVHGLVAPEDVEKLFEMYVFFLSAFVELLTDFFLVSMIALT